MLFKLPFFPKWFFAFLAISLIFVLIDLISFRGKSGWDWLYRRTQPSFYSWEYKMANILGGHPDGENNNQIDSETCLHNQSLDRFRLENARLKEENQRARKLLGASPPLDFKFAPVMILGLPKGKVKLSGGRDKGFKKGLAVVGENRFLGKLVSVQEYNSEVQLVSDGGFRLAVGVWRPDNKPGHSSAKIGAGLVAKGILKGGRRPLVEEVLEGEAVEKGFLVAPLGFPGRFFIGRVTAVSASEGGFKKLFVDWEGKEEAFGTVFVVKNGLLP